MSTSRLGLTWGLAEAILVFLGFELSRFEFWDLLDLSIILFMLVSFYLGTRVGEMSEIRGAFSISQPLPWGVGLVVSAVVIPPDPVLTDMAFVRFLVMFVGALLLVVYAIAGLLSALVGGFFGEYFYERRNRSRLRPLTPLPNGKTGESQKA